MKKKEKRTKLEIREGIQSALEGYRRFDYDYIPFGKGWTVPDGKYRYRHRFPETIIDGFWLTTMRVLAPLALKIIYGAKVTGRKNLKALNGKGALCVCNHISFLDTLFVRQAAGYFRSRHTMTQYNNKGGLGGHIMRHAGMLPFSENLAATRNLIKEMERLLGNGKIINFYAERAMWVNYQKPRPMKEGVFTFAVKFDAPVLPIFCTFKKSKRGHIKKLRINILPPIFPDGTLPRRERAEKMKEEAEKSWQNCYETAYDKPLEYLPDRRKAESSATSSSED